MARIKPRRTIAIATSYFIDNIDVLGQGLVVNVKGEDFSVIFHRDPQFSLVGDRVEYNFDILQDWGGIKFADVDLRDIVPSHRISILPRYTKTVQMARLINAADKYRASGITNSQYNKSKWLHVPTWFTGRTWNKNLSVPVTDTGKVVIKPNDGARGIGQFVVDTSNITTQAFLAEFYKSFEESVTDSAVEDFCKRMNGIASYHSDNENGRHEGIHSLLGQGAVVQSFVPNIAAEFRLITNALGDVTYVQKRRIERVDSGFPQAIGSGVGDSTDKCVCLTDVLSPESIKMLNYVARTAIGPMNSIDLFVTDDGHWGIFEFCNQFGTTGIPSDQLIKMHVDYVVGLIDRYLKGVSDGPLDGLGV